MSSKVRGGGDEGGVKKNKGTVVRRCCLYIGGESDLPV